LRLGSFTSKNIRFLLKMVQLGRSRFANLKNEGLKYRMQDTKGKGNFNLILKRDNDGIGNIEVVRKRNGDEVIEIRKKRPRFGFTQQQPINTVFTPETSTFSPAPQTVETVETVQAKPSGELDVGVKSLNEIWATPGLTGDEFNKILADELAKLPVDMQWPPEAPAVDLVTPTQQNYDDIAVQEPTGFVDDSLPVIDYIPLYDMGCNNDGSISVNSDSFAYPVEAVKDGDGWKAVLSGEWFRFDPGNQKELDDFQTSECQKEDKIKKANDFDLIYISGCTTYNKTLQLETDSEEHGPARATKDKFGWKGHYYGEWFRYNARQQKTLDDAILNCGKTLDTLEISSVKCHITRTGGFDGRLVLDTPKYGELIAARLKSVWKVFIEGMVFNVPKNVQQKLEAYQTSGKCFGITGDYVAPVEEKQTTVLDPQLVMEMLFNNEFKIADVQCGGTSNEENYIRVDVELGDNKDFVVLNAQKINGQWMFTIPDTKQIVQFTQGHQETITKKVDELKCKIAGNELPPEVAKVDNHDPDFLTKDEYLQAVNANAIYDLSGEVPASGLDPNFGQGKCQKGIRTYKRVLSGWKDSLNLGDITEDEVNMALAYRIAMVRGVKALKNGRKVVNITDTIEWGGRDQIYNSEIIEEISLVDSACEGMNIYDQQDDTEVGKAKNIIGNATNLQGKLQTLDKIETTPTVAADKAAADKAAADKAAADKAAADKAAADKAAADKKKKAAAAAAAAAAKKKKEEEAAAADKKKKEEADKKKKEEADKKKKNRYKYVRVPINKNGK